jgi:hypothetical protein
LKGEKMEDNNDIVRIEKEVQYLNKRVKELINKINRLTNLVRNIEDDMPSSCSPRKTFFPEGGFPGL